MLLGSGTTGQLLWTTTKTILLFELFGQCIWSKAEPHSSCGAWCVWGIAMVGPGVALVVAQGAVGGFGVYF